MHPAPEPGPDRLFFLDLRARCIVGVNDDERSAAQEVLISVSLYSDAHRSAGATDDFADAVDYRALKKRVLEQVEQSRFHLVETLAEAVARVCLEPDRVDAATVRVEKPGALRFARTVGVEITRRREDVESAAGPAGVSTA